MARPPAETGLLLSVLDRLIDTEPRVSAEVPLTRSQSLARLKTALRRDLELLLNTRRIAVEPPDSLAELHRSVYMYGLPDLSSFSLAALKDRERLLHVLQSAVRLFEPRLASVHIEALESDEVGTQTLRFRIEGLLRVDPAPEHVSFDTVLELTSGEYEVRGEAHAG